jgi:hypothetical protein
MHLIACSALSGAVAMRILIIQAVDMHGKLQQTCSRAQRQSGIPPHRILRKLMPRPG